MRTLACIGIILVVLGVTLAFWYGIYWVIACFIDSNWAAVTTICLFFLSGGAIWKGRR